MVRAAPRARAERFFKAMCRVQDGRLRRAYCAKGHSFECYKHIPLYLVRTPGDELGVAGALVFARSSMPMRKHV